MKKNLFLAVAFIATFGAIFIYVSNVHRFKQVSNHNVASENFDVSTSTEQGPGNNPTTGNSEKDKAWNVLEKYLKAAKEHDIKSVSKISYQLTDSCKKYSTETDKADCDAKMDTVAYFGSTFNYNDFTEVWSDSKQIILATDFRYEENDSAVSRSRGIIYFVIDQDGIKILSFNHAKGSIIQKGEASKEELTDRLIRFTEDNDKDGKEDYLEECLSVSQDSACKLTDPKVRDSDGNGFWDGTEALFY